MRETLRRGALTTLLVLFGLLASGCGEGGELPTRSIAIFTPKSGALKPRGEDIRLAAALALKKIDHDTKGSSLRLVDGVSTTASPIAAIDALSGTTVTATDELLVSLVPQKLTLTGATGPTTTAPPRISLLPSLQATREALGQYVAAGGSSAARADSPLIAGTPSRQFVSPALAADNYPPAGSEFFAEFEEEYGRAPDRYAIYGYEAVGLIVDALDRLEDAAQPVNRSSLARSALSIKDRFGPVGHYDVLPSGQTTLFVFQARGRGTPPGQAAIYETVSQP